LVLASTHGDWTRGCNWSSGEKMRETEVGVVNDKKRRQERKKGSRIHIRSKTLY